MMEEVLWKTIGEISLELHPERTKALASQLLNLESFQQFKEFRSSLGIGTVKQPIERLYLAWKRNPEVNPKQVSAALNAGSFTAELCHGRMSIEMVWTGPSTSFQASRSTRQVLQEIIDSASRTLFITSFVVYDLDWILESLKKKVSQGVRIHILLELPQYKGGRVSIDSLEFFQSSIPEIDLYQWNQTSGEGISIGTVHAKCIIADGERAFISSANLTTAAMEKNMELGVLIKGGEIPKKLEKHFNALRLMGIIQKT